MAVNALQIAFNAIGIGSAIDHEKLMVPANQRSYAWEESHVQTLFQDLSSAIQSDNPTYFLGTIVLTQGAGDRLEVADGKQRLATATILIAAIRDFLEGQGSQEKQASTKYTSNAQLGFVRQLGDERPALPRRTAAWRHRDRSPRLPAWGDRALDRTNPGSRPT